MNKYKKIFFIFVFTIFTFLICLSTVAAEEDSVEFKTVDSAIVNEKFTVNIPYKLVDRNSNLEVSWSNLNCDKENPIVLYGASNPSGTITMSCSAAKEGVAEVTASLNGSRKKKQITIKSVTTAPTTTTTTTKASSTTTTTTALDKTKNANLKSLKLLDSEGNNVSFTPTFNANTYTYSANVDGKIGRISVQAVAEQDKASISNNNSSYELSVGTTNKIPITVTAEDGITKKTYTVNVFRESLGTDATLKSLVIKEASDMDFVKNKYSYKITVNSSVKKLNITCKPSSEDSKVTIEGNKNLKDGSVVKIIVKAPDDTKKEYTITVNMKKVTTTKNVSKVKAQKNPLIIMGLSLIAFGLIGGILYVIKK